MIMSRILSQYDVGVVTRDLSHADIMHMLENPRMGVDKDKLPQWQAISLQEGTSTRKQDYYDQVHAIFLDYDGHLSYHDFMDRVRYQYYLYTTSSHTEEVHKYRVIVPLAHPMPWAEYHHPVTKHFLTQLFDIRDESTYYNWHKIPALPKDPSATYRYRYHDAQPLDLSPSSDEGVSLALAMEEWRKEQAAIAARREARRAKAKPSIVGKVRYTAKVRASVEAKLAAIPNVSTGDRYMTLRRIIASAAHAQYPSTGDDLFDADAMRDMMPRHLADARVEKLIEDLFRDIQG